MRDIPIAFLLLSIILPMQSALALHSEQISDCSIDNGPCFKTVDMREIRFEITPGPAKTMRELTFTVTAIGINIAPTLLLNLSMPGMYMARNEIVLKKKTDGSYSGRGTLPRCPSGKKIWRAEVTIPGAGKVSYTFNVSQ